MTREGTRERILDEALTLFAERGFEGTSLQEIADRIQVTKAALYYHFRSKDDLLAALVAPLFDDLEAWLTRAEELPATASARRAHLEQYLDFLLGRRRVIGFFTRDIAVLAHPVIAVRGEAVRRRIDRLLLGSELALADRIVATAALAGLQGAVATHQDVAPEVLRAALLPAVRAMLRRPRGS